LAGLSHRSEASAKATLRIDGSLLVQSSVADVGPGSATIMAQIAADAFGTELTRVEFQWGNSLFPKAPGQFGSHTTASVGSAVYDVVKSLQKKNEIARFEYFRFTISSANPDDLFFENGMIVNHKSHKNLLTLSS
jgi:xanthine dehydrogenase YagR molybdenum-binding subunit